MKNDKPKYLNFPISLLQGFMEATKGALGNILDYCIIYEMEVHQKPFIEARKMFNMAEPYDIMNFVEDAKVVFNSTPRNQPRTGLEVEMFWEYYQNNKSDEEKAILLAFLAIKSIVGMNFFYKLGKQEIIFHRMAGHTKAEGELPDTIKPFCTRYKFDKIKAELQDHWGISFYSCHVRGMYISTELDTSLLAYHVEKQKMESKLMQEGKRRRQEQARNYALKELAKPTPKINIDDGRSSTQNKYR